MSTKIIRTVIVAVCAVALMATAPAYASGGQRSTVVMNLVPSGDASAACPGSLFGLAFDLTSPSGKRLGTGRSCIASIDGCDPFQPRLPPDGARNAHVRLRSRFGHRASHAAGGAARRELIRELGHGTVAGGTGAYARATRPPGRRRRGPLHRAGVRRPDRLRAAAEQRQTPRVRRAPVSEVRRRCVRRASATTRRRRRHRCGRPRQAV